MELCELDSSLHADVLVVGAGAAGCTLGYLLAGAGLDVLVLERRRIASKNKLCGGVILTGGLQLLRAMHGTDALRELNLVQMDAMRVLYHNLSTTVPMQFSACPRRNLDQLLGRRCALAGARVVEGADVRSVDEAAHVALVHDARTGAVAHITYGTLVAADGACSRIRTLACGRRPKTVISLAGPSLPLDGTPMLAQRTYRGIAGSCWHIPQGTSAVIGCLFLPESIELSMDKQVSRVRFFAQELGLPQPQLRGAPVPTGDDICLRSEGGTFFVGDAAGLVEGALGAGIHLALLSANALAQELLDAGDYEGEMAATRKRLLADAKNRLWPYTRLSFAVLRDNDPEWPH